MASFIRYTGLALALALGGSAVSGGSAHAAGAPDCRMAGTRVAAQEGGQLISARASGGECVIVVQVQGRGNEGPRRVTRRVSF